MWNADCLITTCRQSRRETPMSKIVHHTSEYLYRFRDTKHSLLDGERLSVAQEIETERIRQGRSLNWLYERWVKNTLHRRMFDKILFQSVVQTLLMIHFYT
jgi:hypothetical protein